jgi:hypothetical protein
MAMAWQEGDLCAADPVLPTLDLGVSVAFAANATHLALRAQDIHGFAAFAVDERRTVRTLVMMQEADMAMHRLAAAVVHPELMEGPRAGEAGIPSAAAPPPSGHGGMSHAMEVQFAYDDDQESTVACVTPGGWLVVAVSRSALPADNGTWHALAALDPLDAFLPHPLESTRNATVVLVAAAPGEDPFALQARLDAEAAGPAAGAPGAGAMAMLGVLAAAAVAGRRWGQGPAVAARESTS